MKECLIIQKQPVAMDLILLWHILPFFSCPICRHLTWDRSTKYHTFTATAVSSSPFSVNGLTKTIERIPKDKCRKSHKIKRFLFLQLNRRKPNGWLERVLLAILCRGSFIDCIINKQRPFYRWYHWLSNRQWDHTKIEWERNLAKINQTKSRNLHFPCERRLQFATTTLYSSCRRVAISICFPGF